MLRKRAFIYSALAGAAASALVLIPSAGSANGDPLILGITTNSATAATALRTTGRLGLQISDPTPGAIALSGEVPGSGVGVVGANLGGPAGVNYGVWGETESTQPDAAGVYGLASSSAATGAGVRGFAGGEGVGVSGESASTAANAAGVLGTIGSTSPGSGSAAVRGINNGTGVFGVGVWGSHAGSGWGVYGSSPAGKGVVGESTTGLAGYFAGNVQVTGTLTKGAGAFKIDHPLDPAHSYLQHSFVESPDMKDVYDGVVRTNAKGFATVMLPAYFQALNKDFRYQLTVIAKPGQFVQAMVVKEIVHNRFSLETSKPNVKVSWQVTGIRHDRYANAHRIQVVVPKQGSADGRYIHPELYGQPLSKSVVVLPETKPGTQPKFRTAAPPAQK